MGVAVNYRWDRESYHQGLQTPSAQRCTHPPTVSRPLPSPSPHSGGPSFLPPTPGPCSRLLLLPHPLPCSPQQAPSRPSHSAVVPPPRRILPDPSHTHSLYHGTRSLPACTGSIEHVTCGAGPRGLVHQCVPSTWREGKDGRAEELAGRALGLCLQSRVLHFSLHHKPLGRGEHPHPLSVCLVQGLRVGSKVLRF